MTEDHARDRLKRFLYRRDLDRAAIDAAVARFDDPAVQAVVPAPSLRAALLMMTGWRPYEVTLDAILGTANPSGEPFEAIVFERLRISEAIATIEPSRSGRFRMIFSDAFASEAPEQLLPVIVHESLHGGGFNSRQEEVTANILDAVAYGELLLIDPRVAHFGTELAIFNNVELLALLNSMGRGGGGHVGISSSAIGDVFVGPNLDEFDAESIQAVIESDSFYGSLPTTGSPGQPTFSALVGRFPGAERLGVEPDFTDAALAVIDEGVGQVISPREAVALARLLGLLITARVTEDLLPARTAESLAERPFVPEDANLFSPRRALKVAEARTDSEGRLALESALISLGAGKSRIERMLDDYDDPAGQDLIPDPSLRASTLWLGGEAPWDLTVSAVLDTENAEGQPVPVLFADLPGSLMVTRGDRISSRVAPSILINSWLQGEPIPVLASYIVEGTLLQREQRSKDEAIAANLLGALSYGRALLREPDLAQERTWGVIQRNRDLFALINSSSWSDVQTRRNADSVGFLEGSNGVIDILPGVYDDATSFASFIEAKAWPGGLDDEDVVDAPPIFSAYLDFAGVDSTVTEATVRFDSEALEALDARLGTFLSADDTLQLAAALKLGVS
jgi:hypothetical protein